MSRYLVIAADANTLAQQLLALIPEENRPQASEHIARLVNYGLRMAPRAVHSTVRFNAVKRSVQGLPVKVSMVERTDPRTQRKYNALVTEPVGGQATVEGANDDNGDS